MKFFVCISSCFFLPLSDRCAKSSQIKTVSSSNIFFKGSRFRYSGRVAKEVIEASSKIQREPPEVCRVQFGHSRSFNSLSHKNLIMNMEPLVPALPSTNEYEETATDNGGSAMSVYHRERMCLVYVSHHLSQCVCVCMWVCVFVPIRASELSWQPSQNSSDVRGGLTQSSLEMEVSDRPNIGDTLSCGSQGRAGGLGLDVTPERLESEGMEEGPAGPLEVFHPGESTDDRESAIVMAEALRCQVKITTRRNLHLRIANHTARDVYVRLVGHGGRIAGISTGLQKNTLEQSVVSVKDSVPLSPFKPSAAPADTEQQSNEGGNSALGNNMQPPRVSMETSNLRPHPCASMLPTPVDDSQGGVDLLFSSSVQSPARLLRELHADPDIQAQLEAERERDRAYERTRLAASSRMGGVLTSSLLLLSSNERVNACLLSVARFVAVVMGVLLVTVPTLLLLLESDIDVSFLHEIRQTPEFEQFHYEYYCPLRRWILCRISMAMENLWSD
ncbi:hypothetical protein FQN60_017609 [Etheostoma spectabile]|uniref:FERM adjacent domain-containing protein n=1 Tax=Etheostoma spectabile TaxID=54343 RepID=A0A5J5DFN7_9PERO|nr:hypothetical protein FQN60_017609 [Etheostoma spectabile]